MMKHVNELLKLHSFCDRQRQLSIFENTWECRQNVVTEKGDVISSQIVTAYTGRQYSENVCCWGLILKLQTIEIYFELEKNI